MDLNRARAWRNVADAVEEKPNPTLQKVQRRPEIRWKGDIAFQGNLWRNSTARKPVPLRRLRPAL
jgi:hypothetical protein